MYSWYGSWPHARSSQRDRHEATYYSRTSDRDRPEVHFWGRVKEVEMAETRLGKGLAPTYVP